LNIYIKSIERAEIAPLFLAKRVHRADKNPPIAGRSPQNFIIRRNYYFSAGTPLNFDPDKNNNYENLQDGPLIRSCTHSLPQTRATASGASK
jgi:hypothetical protein